AAHHPAHHQSRESFENKRFALARVVCESISSEMPFKSATNLAVCTTYSGIFDFPRIGTGAKNGASVSTCKRSSGRNLTTSRKASAFLKVTTPLIEISKPLSVALFASAIEDVKQCKIPVTRPRYSRSTT